MVKEHKDEALFYRNEKAFMGEKVPLTHEFTKSHSQAQAAWESSAWRWNGLRFSIIKKSTALDLHGFLFETDGSVGRLFKLGGLLSWKVFSGTDVSTLTKVSVSWLKWVVLVSIGRLSMVVTVRSYDLFNIVALWHTLAGRRISSFMFAEFHDGVLTGG